MKKAFLILVSLLFTSVIVLSFTGCDSGAVSGLPSSVNEEETENNMGEYLDGTVAELVRDNPVKMLQLTPVEIGEELVVLHTNFGDITLRLFPDEAPLAVENFLTHARNGFYDGVIFHRVIPGFMIQSGDPTGTGSGGHSIWGEPFGLEASFNLRHFRGALAMAHARGAMGSQFYIVQNSNLAAGYVRQFTDLLESLDDLIGVFSDGHRLYLRDIHLREAYEHFLAEGGTPHLDWLYGSQEPHTVFGHVVSGMDVVDAIAITNAVNHRPNEDVVINSISFIIYE